MTSAAIFILALLGGFLILYSESLVTTVLLLMLLSLLMLPCPSNVIFALFVLIGALFLVQIAQHEQIYDIRFYSRDKKPWNQLSHQD